MKLLVQSLVKSSRVLNLSFDESFFSNSLNDPIFDPYITCHWQKILFTLLQMNSL